MRKKKCNRHSFIGNELLNKKLGIIGLGNVGHRVARFAKAFEMNVKAYDPYISDEVFERNNVKKTDLEDLLSSSDIISLHVPLNKETYNMLDDSEIQKMKNGGKPHSYIFKWYFFGYLFILITVDFSIPFLTSANNLSLLLPVTVLKL